MTEALFYMLNGVDRAGQIPFVCRLAARAFREGRKVFCWVSDEAQAQALDAQLWHFQEEAFIPHRCTDAANEPESAVEIGCQPGAGHVDVLINLTDQVPPFHQQFQRVLEVVVEPTRDVKRQAYQFYQGCGYPVKSHIIK